MLLLTYGATVRKNAAEKAPAPGVALDPARLKAVVFDMDGTLYRQGPMRRAMLWRLLRTHAVRPSTGLRTLRVLAAYRQAQETLREGAKVANIAEAQIQLACERTGAERGFVADCVARWMEREPLALLPRCPQPGLLEFLRVCKGRSLRLGVLSDYPAGAKLEALGLDGLFDVVLCAQGSEIGAFKPDPRGLLLALERLGVCARESLYVGDRVLVDAAAAARAQVPCAILSKRRGTGHEAWMQVPDYPHLQHRLWG